LSCNIPFAELGMQLGGKAILDQAEKFGFNTTFDIPMRAAASTFPEYLDEPQTALASFGQFDVRATPLQIALVSASIANGGKLMYPNVIGSVTASNGKPVQTFAPRLWGQPISAQTATTITQMMVNGVNNGAASNAKINGVAVAGKTGTAENGAQPNTLWFTGFAPADGPHKYAVTVLVENGGGMGKNGYGNLIAAPVAKRVLEAVLNK
jgi:peptidoglycan glycosyltransferase